MGKFATMPLVKQPQQWTGTTPEELSSVSSTTSKRSWLSRLSSFVRPRKVSRSTRSPSPASPTTAGAPHDPARAAVTATWVNATSGSHTAPVANAWRSEVTLHPSTYYHPQNVVVYQPPPTYMLPSGPTALSPSPYLAGAAPQRRHRAYTTSASAHAVTVHPFASAVPPPLPSPTQSWESYDSQMSAPRALPPRAPVPTQWPPLPSQAMYDAHAAQAHLARARSKSHHQPARSLSSQKAPSPTVSPTFGGSFLDREPQLHAYTRSIHTAKSSPSLTISDALSTWTRDSGAPSAWATPESRMTKRLSAATCASTRTFGV